MYDLASLSLQPPASFPELYQELWWYSGAPQSVSSVTTAGGAFVAKGGAGTSGYVTSSTASQAKLHNLSSSWPVATKFAFEATLWTNNSSYQASAQLWDMTTNTAVAGTLVTTTSTTATVLRSGQVTLTPGHVYGISFWTAINGNNINLVDASLIIFPPAGSVSPSLSSISLANPSGGSLKEAYYPLWMYSSGINSGTNILTSGSQFVTKGNNGMVSGTSSSATTLHTLNSNWSPSQKFALEASLESTSSSATAYLALWDKSSGSIISASQISTTSTTPTLLRSGSFTLTPSHSLALTGWVSSSAGYSAITKAHLIALGG